MQGHGRVYKLIWNHYMKQVTSTLYQIFSEVFECILAAYATSMVQEGLKQSDYWKNNHHKNLNLYTAWSDNYVPEECEKTFFDCYVRELKVIEEELNLFGVHNRSAIINKIHHIEHNIQVAIQITESMTANCNKCEQYEEKPIEEFKKSFVTLTQKMQSNANGKK
ncbi:interleukin-15-like isoform X5 [Pseudophryne corroboree]